MNLLKLLVGLASLLPEAWVSFVFAAAFVLPAVCGERPNGFYWTMAGIEVFLGLVVVWATWWQAAKT